MASLAAASLDFPRETMTPVKVYYSGRYQDWKAEGYWNFPEWQLAEMEDPAFDEIKEEFAAYPLPIERVTAWSGQKEFVDRLRAIQERAFNGVNGLMVLDADGSSSCRLEKGVRLGTSEFRDKTNKILWTGDFLSHYVEKHNVMPSEAFYNYVIKFKLV